MPLSKQSDGPDAPFGRQTEPPDSPAPRFEPPGAQSGGSDARSMSQDKKSCRPDSVFRSRNRAKNSTDCANEPSGRADGPHGMAVPRQKARETAPASRSARRTPRRGAGASRKEVNMKEIGSISLTSMNNAAHFLFVSNVSGRAEKDGAVSEKCPEQVKSLREAVAAEDESLQLSAKSLVTDKIAEADKERDKLYSGYKKAVSGYEGFPDGKMAEAAKVLAQHIKDYKINPQTQRDKETGLLVNFVHDLEGKFAEQVGALSLGAFVTKLKEANENVRELTERRMEERSARTAGALKAAREASDAAYKALVQHVNAHALLDGDGACDGFIDYANAEISHFKQEVLGGRKKRPSPSGTGEDDG